MDIIIKSSHSHDVIKKIADLSNTEFSVDCDEAIIELPETIGTGFIRAVHLNDGIKLLTFDCTLFEIVNIQYKYTGYAPLRFIYCAKGQVAHSMDKKEIQYQLNAYMGAISCGVSKEVEHFRFPINLPLLITIIQVDRTEYFEKISCNLPNLPKQLAAVFEDVRGENFFLHQSNYSYVISESINLMNDCMHTGMVRRIFLESKVLEILSFQINQYDDDINFQGKRVLLKKYDVEKIIKARDILITNLQNPPKIVDLARLAGVNQQKLKRGFKLIFDTTINRYLRSYRMEQAKILLLEGSLSIGAIAEEVGYTNPSHFSKRFKEKYGVLPKEYSRKILSEIGNSQI